MNRPNILYLHSHDTGRYIQPYGHAVPTPNLQRLAEDGMLFRQAFCAAPTCSPSRAALLTGQCAHSSGMLGLAHRGFSLNDYGQHLLHTLRREGGYLSALAGIQHLARQHQDRAKDAATVGYDVYLGDPDEAEVVAQRFLEAQTRQPFFLDVGFFETHRRGKLGGRFSPQGRPGDGRYTIPPAPLPDAPETRQDVADYKLAAGRLDRKVGVVLEALEASGLAENTLVIFTTDHGVPFPNMKCSLTDHGTGVALIVRGPGGFAGGKVCDAMVSHLDIFPTLCDLLDIARPPWLQGQSLLPLVRGGLEEIHDELFAEVTHHAAYEPKRSVRTKRWKYIRHFGDPLKPVLANCDDSPSKNLWLKHGWQERGVAAEQLFDLVFDPNEMHNLADSPAHTDTIAEMRGRLERWMRATDDPLLPESAPARSTR